MNLTTVTIVSVCFLQVMNCSLKLILNHRTPSTDTNAFLMWLALPFGFKKRLAKNLKAKNVENEIDPDDNRILPAAFHLKTNARLIFEALKHAPNPEIESLFKSIPDHVKKVLNMSKGFVLIELLSNTLRSGESIVYMLKLFERVSDFNLADKSILGKIRDEALKRNDRAMMNLTDEYPEIIEESFKEQAKLILAIKPDGSPKNLWESMCSEYFPGMKLVVKPEDHFMKFRIFSEPVNTKNWTLLMLALATENYNLARTLPVKMNRLTESPLVPFVDGSHITKIEQLLPFIPNEYIKEYVVDLYELPADLNLIKTASSFKTLDDNGMQIEVQVLNGFGNAPPTIKRTRIDLDTEILVEDMFLNLFSDN